MKNKVTQNRTLRRVEAVVPLLVGLILILVIVLFMRSCHLTYDYQTSGPGYEYLYCEVTQIEEKQITLQILNDDGSPRLNEKGDDTFLTVNIDSLTTNLTTGDRVYVLSPRVITTTLFQLNPRPEDEERREKIDERRQQIREKREEIEKLRNEINELNTYE